MRDYRAKEDAKVQSRGQENTALHFVPLSMYGRREETARSK